MFMKKQKIFRDPVHGYITIDADIVEGIIDTALFQRLKRIEQTSMRCVYPAARHDRFIHSLGTYYLAKVAVEAMVNNTPLLKEIEKEGEYQSLTFNFEMAALLHDVGHSPLSHTLEYNYGTIKNFSTKIPKINDYLVSKLFPADASKAGEERSNKNRLFSEDLKSAQPNEHEIVSAILVCEEFHESLKMLCTERDVSLDLEFIVRCIIGATYSDSSIINRTYRNSLIKLLNSQAIDVDKLDYIKRDSVVSGYENISVDCTRLLGSLKCVEKNNTTYIVFGKPSLSVIQNVVDCRNKLYRWIYGHHKVVYESNLIKTAFEKAINVDPKNDNTEKREEYFSLTAVTDNLISDDDIWGLFKQKYRDSNSNIKEIDRLFDRRNHHTPLWKSLAEFNLLFPPSEKNNPVGKFSLDKMLNICSMDSQSGVFKDFITYINNNIRDPSKSDEDVALFLTSTLKINVISDSDVYIEVNDEIYSYTQIMKDTCNENLKSFVYSYIDKYLLNDEFKNLFEGNKKKFLEEFVRIIKAYPGFAVTVE